MTLKSCIAYTMQKITNVRSFYIQDLPIKSINYMWAERDESGFSDRSKLEFLEFLNLAISCNCLGVRTNQKCLLKFPILVMKLEVKDLIG